MTIDAPRDAVWAVLSDFPRAASLMPDAGEVRRSEDGGYEGRMRLRVGPIGLNLSGTVHVEQDDDQGTWSMKAGARDRRVGGGFQAQIDVKLARLSTESSELNIRADVQLLGRLGQLGQPLIKRKAESTIRQFAENLRAAASAGK
ncbi:MAG: SRPBCC family protein [Chloroflexi bacterium]|nr:SRPBCC family protein [Chloroflexota bacterium]